MSTPDVREKHLELDYDRIMLGVGNGLNFLSFVRRTRFSAEIPATGKKKNFRGRLKSSAHFYKSILFLFETILVFFGLFIDFRG